jgi:AraC family cel operon transcriptional repressor
MRQLRFRDLLAPGMWAHFHRSRHVFHGRPPLHTHDFHEVFWIEAGRGLMNTLTGEVPLTLGDLVLVHADDAHGFSTRPGAVLQLANLAFSRSAWSDLLLRYGIVDDPFAQSAERRRRHLAAGELGGLRQAAVDLDHGLRDQLAVERVLLTLLGLFRTQPVRNDLPEWLAAGCRELEAGRWREGTRALVAASGRSREHVARVCRELLGTTPTALVTDARLRHVARRLVESDAPIAEIAAETGLGNLAHLYRLFQRTYGTSPGAWRRRHREVIAG